MKRGICKWWNDLKGFGFIVNPDGGKDIFVHYTAIDSVGYNRRTLIDGEEVEYESAVDEKGEHATVVKRVKAPATAET